MAGLLVGVQCPESAFSTSTKTMLVIKAPTNQRLKVKEWSISFIGTSNTAQPIRVEVYNIATGGSLGTGTGAVINKVNPSDQETPQTTGNYACSAEPSGTMNIIFTEEVHPQQGYTWQAPYGNEIGVQGGTWFGIRVTAAAGTSCAVRLIVEE
jgi:hypothetical protein